MIYTLTLNTAIDMNIRCDALEPNIVNRTSHTEYSPNGKGVNVSLVLKKFNIDSTVLGFFGGFSGKYIYDELIQRGISTRPCWVEGTTRINVFISDGNQEYKLVGQGPFIADDKKQKLIDLINSLEDASHLSISGSLPNNIEPEFYDAILTLCQKKKVQVILDISHPKLKSLLSYKPLLIKPNDDELNDIFGFETTTEKQVIAAMLSLHQMGAQNILLTLGSKGLYFSNGQHIWFCNSVNIKLVSSACAGDASLAAFLSEWLDNAGKANTDVKQIERAMKKASATGANVAESDGLGLLDKISDYMNQLIVTQIQ